MNIALRSHPLAVILQALITLGSMLALPASGQPVPADPLPSWNEGASKRAIIDFVTRVTREGGPDFVPVADRIATFDNDGTLWCEQPAYTQAIFVFDRAKQLCVSDPELRVTEPYRSILEGDQAAMARFGSHEITTLLAATHAGMTTDEFTGLVRNWLDTARHPRFHQLFKACVYQPQLELLAYLRTNGFKTFIVSGGGIDFLRAFADGTYGIPPEQVIGSSTKTRFELRDGKAVLVKLPELNSLDDKQGKPININLHVGRRPVLAFGNSDGDLEMLQYTASGAGPRLMLLLHHDDASREYAYDRKSRVGTLDLAWDEARRRGWLIVSMKDDFNRVFPFQQ